MEGGESPSSATSFAFVCNSRSSLRLFQLYLERGEAARCLHAENVRRERKLIVFDFVVKTSDSL